MADDTLVEVAEHLASVLGDKCLLVGGLAVSAWGHVRATEDVDFVSSLKPDDVQARLSSEGISTELRRGSALEGDIPWVVHGVLHGIPFQILPPLVPLDWSRATRIPMMGGGNLQVIGIDDLLHLKVKAGGFRDLWDVAMLTKYHPERRARARELAESHGVLEELDRWLADPRLKPPSLP